MEGSNILNQIYDNIAAIGIAMVTTEGCNGSLHSRPMYTLQIDDEDQLWFFTHKDTLKTIELNHHQKVNIAYVDVHSHSYISISGEGHISDDTEKIDELWDPSLEAWFPEGPDSKGIQLLVIKIHSASFWDEKKAVMVTGITPG